MIISKQKAAEAATELGVELEGLTPDVLKAAHRAAARLHHPDAGGTAQGFARVDWAYTALKHWLAKRPAVATPMAQEKCLFCGGAGSVVSRKGFGTLRRQCGNCQGTGDATYRAAVTPDNYE